MTKQIVFAGAALWVLAIAAPGHSQDKKGAMDIPLVVTLKAIKDTYTLDLGGKTGKEFLEELEKSAKKGGRLPQPPAVELEIEVRNQGRERVEFWVSGDPMTIDLELKGPGAKAITPPLAFTADFRLPKLMALEPGKSHTFTLKSLSGGFRGAGTWHYWAEPGEYTLTARLQTGVRPVPAGAKEIHGAGKVTLTSNTVKLKVMAK